MLCLMPEAWKGVLGCVRGVVSLGREVGSKVVYERRVVLPE